MQRKGALEIGGEKWVACPFSNEQSWMAHTPASAALREENCHVSPSPDIRRISNGRTRNRLDAGRGGTMHLGRPIAVKGMANASAPLKRLGQI